MNGLEKSCRNAGSIKAHLRFMVMNLRGATIVGCFLQPHSAALGRLRVDGELQLPGLWFCQEVNKAREGQGSAFH